MLSMSLLRTWATARQFCTYRLYVQAPHVARQSLWKRELLQYNITCLYMHCSGWVGGILWSGVRCAEFFTELMRNARQRCSWLTKSFTVVATAKQVQLEYIC